MANYVSDGYGQVELNNVAFRRDGRIEAQCALDETDFASTPAQNGMLLAVDNITRTITKPKSGSKLIALHYSAEHMYDERKPGLKDFHLFPGTFLPRLGYLAVGDKFTTNTVSYNGTVEALDGLLDKIDTTPVYGVPSSTGYIEAKATLAGTEPVQLLAIGKTTMPSGVPGIKFQVIKA